MAFLWRVAFSTRGYLDNKIGPLPNGHLFSLHYDSFMDIVRDLEQQPVLDLHPLSLVMKQLQGQVVHGARRPKGGG